jgi:hypothetical protein
MTHGERRRSTELPVRSLEIVERDGHRARALHVFCPRRYASTDVETCVTCAFVCTVSDSAVVCAPPGLLEVPESAPDDALVLGPDARALRTPVGALCAIRSVGVHIDALVEHGPTLLAHEAVVVVLGEDNTVYGVLFAAGLPPLLGALDAEATALPEAWWKPGQMDGRPTGLPESAPLSEAIELMVHGHLRLVPVTTDERRFVGLVTDLDVLRWVAGTRRAPLDRAEERKEMSMSQTTNELKAELKKSLALLNTLRDEVRVSLHLAGMEAKDRWNKIEPRLNDVERAARDASEASRAAVAEALKVLKDFRASLK